MATAPPHTVSPMVRPTIVVQGTGSPSNMLLGDPLLLQPQPHFDLDDPQPLRQHDEPVVIDPYLPYRVEKSMDHEQLMTMLQNETLLKDIKKKHKDSIDGAATAAAPLPSMHPHHGKQQQQLQHEQTFLLDHEHELEDEEEQMLTRHEYHRIRIEGAVDTRNSPEFAELSKQLRECTNLRRAYQTASLQLPGDNPKDDPSILQSCPFDGKTTAYKPFDGPLPASWADKYEAVFVDGVFHVIKQSDRTDAYTVPDVNQFYKDLNTLLFVTADGPIKSFSFKRLKLLESKFSLFKQLNELEEKAAGKLVPHRDFYNVRKVDTHVHHSACMNQKHLLRFIKSKLKRSSEVPL